MMVIELTFCDFDVKALIQACQLARERPMSDRELNTHLSELESILQRKLENA